MSAHTSALNSAIVAVGVHGAAGRMGRMLLAGALQSDRFKLSAATVRPTHPDIGSDAGRLVGKWACEVPLQAASHAALAGCDVLIDFSLPEGHSELVAACEGQALVVGTTGLSEAQRATLRSYAERAPVVLASNFSTGVNILLGLVGKAAGLVPDYHVEIVEMHHQHKVDAPSGTALSLGRAVVEARGDVLRAQAVHGREGHTGPRSDREIGFHSLRGGDVAGEHHVYLAGPGERLTLSHLATSRQAFADGALRAALWVVEQPPGLYDMQDVLGLR